jgi:formylglycine-generating enzyme required for sulfatase activity
VDITLIDTNRNDYAGSIMTEEELEKEKLSYRLSTEAEWKYAARGGGAVVGKPRSKFCFGDDPNLLKSYGWYDQNASSRGEGAHPVGQLRPNQLGLFDMHGNIWEWMFDNDGGLGVLRDGGFKFQARVLLQVFESFKNPKLEGKLQDFDSSRSQRKNQS